jgi:uncharacterized protein (TIGR02001 family)
MLKVKGSTKSRVAVLLLSSTAIITAAIPGFAADLSLKDAPAADILPFGGDKVDITGYVQGTSDYLFRGISQSARGPAAQGGADLTYGMWYVGTFLSNVDFGVPGTHMETDIYGGIRPKWGAVTFDFGVIGYLYPGNNGQFEQNYYEVKAGASTTVWKDVTVGGTFYYSPDSNGEIGATYTIEGTASKPVYKYGPLDFALSGTVGGVFYDKEFLPQSTTPLKDYVYYNVGLTTTYKEKVSLDLRYSDTSLSKTDAPCGISTFQCGSTFVATAKWAF